jgi:hypothetical protein
MESKKINQLATEMSPATSDLTIIGDPITGVSKKVTLLQIADLFQTTGTVTSVAVTETGDALTITGSPITSAGTINIGFAGEASQYVRGDGALADFPTTSGGGSSVSYYLNSSVSQGTIGGVAYRELNKEPIIGAGTDITITANGYIANYLTDANDPDVILIPGGNFNCEFYFSVNSNAHNAYVYAELYKYDGTTFTLLGSSQSVPEYLTNGTTISPYYFAIPVPSSALAITDRLAIRIYANVDTKEVTLHTENSHLCQVLTTLSKGMVSLNNLTDQSQYLATGTAGTNFAIASSGDTHTFNLPVASATNTGKLSSTDWSTFNNKQNALTNPITGLGNSGNVAYFDGVSSITSENSFNYDASTNRLGVNTTVPNATIGANAGLDSGYSLLLKNDNANYNGIGFATTSTYGNVIGTEKLGTAPARNLTLLNQSGYISITEVGNLGVNILNPNTGLDIYNGTSAYLWLHTANSGITGTDGVRLALFSNNGANLRNFEGAMSITSEGDFQVITLGAENIRVNSTDGKVGIGNPTTVSEMLTVNGSIQQSGVLSSLLKTNGDGKLIAAVAGTDYVVPSALSGYVPTSRTITINGTTQNLSADISYSVGTIDGSGADGRVAFYNGTNSITSEAGFIYDSSTNRLGVNTSVPNATIGADAALNSGYGLLIKTGASNYNGIGIAIDSTYGNTIEAARLGTAPSRNLTLLNVSGYVSLTETGNFGVGILTPNNGIDIYNSTQSQLWLHNAATGITATDGVRLALFNSKEANLRNFDGGLSITAEGDFSIITIGAENFRINSANGFVGIGNPATLPSMLTVNGGATITGLTTGQVLFPTSGGTLSGSSSLFWDNTNAKLGLGTTTLSGARLTITSVNEAEHLHLVANAPALTFTNALSLTYYAGIGMATASNNFVTGAVQGDLALGAFNTSSILFYNNNTNTMRMSLNGSGAAIFSGSVTARGPKSQIVVDGNSVGAAISLNNSIVGVNRRNWLIGTEENVEGDFVIKRSTVSGGTANTTVLSMSRDGAATFSGATQDAVQTVIRMSGKNASNQVKALDFKLTAGTPLWTISTAADGTDVGLNIMPNGTSGLSLAYTGAATFSSSVTAKTSFTTAGTNASPVFEDWLMSNPNGSSTLTKISIGNSFASSAGTWMKFSVNSNTAVNTPVDVMTLKYDGNVGIGTTSPDSKLHVIDSSGNSLRIGFLSGSSNFNLYDASVHAFRNNGGTSEYMRITSGGNVGIGTSSPTKKLDVSGNDAELIRLSSTATNGSYLGFANSGTLNGAIGNGSNIISGLSNSDLGIWTTGLIAFQAGGSERMRIRADGVIIASSIYNTNISGTTRTVSVRDDGALGYVSSTRESKININTLNNVEWLNKLNSVLFNYRKKDEEGNYTNDFYNSINYGLIADEVEKVNKELVFYDVEENGDLKLAGVHYDKLIIPMLKMLQIHQAQIEAQQAQIEELKALINK